MTAKHDKDKHDQGTTTAAQDLDKQSGNYKMQKSGNSDTNAIGVDIGTSKIVFAQKKNGEINYVSHRNAFITVEPSSFTEKILNQNQIRYHELDNSLVVYGDGAEVFADMLNAEARRPMQKGLLNANETYSIEIIKKIIDDLAGSSRGSQARLVFSVPDAPKDSPADIIYHEAILRRHLEQKGFTTNSINEGLAVVFSELEDESFTGLGISAGGGMCNVCLAYLSVPLISFSINKGGDYLDDAAASVTGMVNTRVRSFKENGFNLNSPPRNKVEDALQVYHDDLIATLVKALKESIHSTSSTLNVDRQIPIVLSGGTAKVNGFKNRFEQFVKSENLPLDFGKIRIAKDPLTATAKGALIAAMN